MLFKSLLYDMLYCNFILKKVLQYHMFHLILQFKSTIIFSVFSLFVFTKCNCNIIYYYTTFSTFLLSNISVFLLFVFAKCKMQLQHYLLLDFIFNFSFMVNIISLKFIFLFLFFYYTSF